VVAEDDGDEADGSRWRLGVARMQTPLAARNASGRLPPPGERMAPPASRVAGQGVEV